MRTITQVSKAMQEVLVTSANEIGLETAFTQRERVLSGSSFAVGLITGWQANPQASLANLSQAVGNAGTPLSRQGLSQRFDASAVVFCRRLLEQSLTVLVQALPQSTNLLMRFSSVELVDSTVVTLPNQLANVWQGCGGFGEQASVSAVKLHVCWDVKHGNLKELNLTDSTVHDRKSAAHQHPVPVGGLRIGDLGYFKLADLAQIAASGAYFLSRYKLGTQVYLQGSEQAVNFAEFLPQGVGECVDCAISLGKEQRLACRLVAERVPAAVVEQRHERLREEARQEQRSVSEQALVMAQWTIYVTNIPPTLASSSEIFVLGRYRWQIELLFKLWKSDLGIDQWRSSNPYRILCELYLKLVGAIVTHWLLLLATWQNPCRSLRQAIPTIRGLAWQFANSLSQAHLLRHTLHALCRALSTCRMDKARGNPRAFQLLDEHSLCLN